MLKSDRSVFENLAEDTGLYMRNEECVYGGRKLPLSRVTAHTILYYPYFIKFS